MIRMLQKAGALSMGFMMAGVVHGGLEEEIRRTARRRDADAAPVAPSTAPSAVSPSVPAPLYINKLECKLGEKAMAGVVWSKEEGEILQARCEASAGTMMESFYVIGRDGGASVNVRCAPYEIPFSAFILKTVNMSLMPDAFWG